ncbi:MAG TPA: hypothetical protein VHB25_17030 [Gemmatimonadaceae bacterium]|nr:hypothetical protein [Gemmatimonadaceae bacterium]
MSSVVKSLALVAPLIVASASTLRAQSVRAADSLLAAGALSRAESVYYAAARVRPHDPSARRALGRYLVERGAPRVGGTLFEEAIRFGGDASLIGADLVPVYLATAQYDKLAALATASPAERARARWLDAHDSRVIAPDSIVAAPFHASADTVSLGRVLVRIDGRPYDATLSAQVRGIVIGDTTRVARSLRTFGPGATSRSAIAAVDSIAFGRMTITNVPVTLSHGGDAVVIGLGELARFAPRFDPRGARVWLYVESANPGARPRMPAGTSLPSLALGYDIQVLRAGGWLSLSAPPIAALLRERPWDYIARRGEIVIEP